MKQPIQHAAITRTGEYLLSEADGTRPREQITIAAGAGKLMAGTVLGQLTGNGEWVAYDAGGIDDGRRTAAGILYAGVDATNNAVQGVAHVKQCEVFEALLTGLDDDAAAALLARRIILR